MKKYGFTQTGAVVFPATPQSPLTLGNHILHAEPWGWSAWSIS